ncbi:MAG: DUF3108 domain-containing protein [Acidobacteriota bacterium]|nr:DUF3108 domain-containing protein [Acidobacteriota bacterium]
MRVIRSVIIVCTIAAVPAMAAAADLNCKGPGNVEEFRYSWRMRGGLAWVAGLVFPTSGVGELKTTFPQGADQSISSELLIQPNDRRSGFFVYQSEMDTTGQKTLMTYHGYAWKNKSRKERTIFDYIKRIAHVHKETPEKQWDRTDTLPADALRDVLTAIFFLRQNATTIQLPITTRIYSDGKSYPVIIRSADRRTFNIEDQQVNALGFEIVDAPGGSRKWPGGVKVWVSDDQRRIPFRIDIDQSMGSLQLDLKSVEACAFMQAASAR